MDLWVLDPRRQAGAPCGWWAVPTLQLDRSVKRRVARSGEAGPWWAGMEYPALRYAQNRLCGTCEKYASGHQERRVAQVLWTWGIEPEEASRCTLRVVGGAHPIATAYFAIRHLPAWRRCVWPCHPHSASLAMPSPVGQVNDLPSLSYKWMRHPHGRCFLNSEFFILNSLPLQTCALLITLACAMIDPEGPVRRGLDPISQGRRL